jgi:hypothetical protein
MFQTIQDDRRVLLTTAQVPYTEDELQDNEDLEDVSKEELPFDLYVFFFFLTPRPN